MYTLSVDIGGTFTDIVAFDEAKERTVVGKALTTPGDLRKGVMAGLEQAAAELNIPLRNLLGEAHRFVHATTQSSNAIFAFAGAKTAVVTTRGFGDTLTIMRATGRVAGLSVFERHHYRATAKPRLVHDDGFRIDAECRRSDGPGAGGELQAARPGDHPRSLRVAERRLRRRAVQHGDSPIVAQA